LRAVPIARTGAVQESPPNRLGGNLQRHRKSSRRNQFVTTAELRVTLACRLDVK
jgi:hypothetical protein